MQELTELEPDIDQDGVSMYTNSLQDKQKEQIDNLDDSLGADEDNDCLVPSKEDMTQTTSGESSTNHSEKNLSLVDELFDDIPTVSQNSTANTASTQIETFDKKIAPLFTSTKKKRRFKTPVQSIIDENGCNQADNETTSDASKTEKAKPLFKSGKKTKPSIGKKRKLSDTSKDRNEEISQPPLKEMKLDTNKHGPDQPANTDDAEANGSDFNIQEAANLSSDGSIKKVSSTTSEEISLATEKVNKKKRQKKVTEGKEGENGTKKTSAGKQSDGGKTKPLFKPGAKSSTAKKQKVFEKKKDQDKKVNEPPVKSDANCQSSSTDAEAHVKEPKSKQKSCQPATSIDAEAEVNFNIKDRLSNNPVQSSSTTTRDVLPAGEVNKNKRQKEATEDKEVINTGTKKAKEHVSKKKAAQQQAKIDKSYKNLDREQRKAEKELQKISKELEKVKKQKSKKDKKSVKTVDQPLSSSSSSQVWVQCDQPNCLKWRRLRDCKNPSEIPEEWYCSMNPGECSIRIIHLHY